MEDDDIQVTSDDDTAPAAASTTSSSSAIDPTDPDATLGSPQRFWVWLAPDWSDYGDSQKDKSWTRVQVEETKYQDGRKVTRVLDANQRPIDAPLNTEVDTKQQERHRKAVAAAERNKPAPPTKTVRGPDGKNHIMERNPETGAYDIDRGLAPTQPPTPPRKAVAVRYEKDGTKVTEYDNGETTREAQSPSETRAAAQAGRPSVNIEDDGKGGVVAILTYPDGRVETKPVQGVAGKSDRVTVDGAVYEKGPDGKWTPIVNTQAAEPAGAPQPRLTLGTITQDLQNYAAFLNEKVKKGELTPQQADDLLKKRRELATSAVQEQTALINAQRGIMSDEVTQRSQDIDETASRRKDALASRSGALSAYMSLLPQMDVGGGQLLADAISAETDRSRAEAEAWGGLREHPRVELPPFLAQVRNATGDPTAAQLSEQNQSVTQETDAIIGDLLGPSSAPASSAAPIFSPPPPIPGQTRVTPIRPDVAIPEPGSVPPVNPMPGEPGANPQAPVGQRAPFRPSAPWIDQARYGQEYDPSPVLAKLMQDPDLPPDWLFDAYRDVFKAPAPKPRAA